MRLIPLFNVRNCPMTLKIAKQIMHCIVIITIEKGHVFSDQFERTVPDWLLQSVLCFSCMICLTSF